MSATTASARLSSGAIARPGGLPWLFSAPVDIGVFLGSAVLAFAALLAGKAIGIAAGGTPDWTWVPAILLVDVAHVYATGFRVYLDPEELRRRPILYTLVPVVGFALGTVLYGAGPLVFWRALAYLAVFHFVRQQYGWVALYRRRAGETDRAGRMADSLAIYAATLYPLAYWHAHLPRRFWWFVPGDFWLALPRGVERILGPVYVSILAVYVAFALRDTARGRWNPGKHIVVATTAATWYAGIVATNSDFAFTVTNVFTHGIPYLALVFWFARKRSEKLQFGLLHSILKRGPFAFLGILWIFAYAEEAIWDRAVWHDHGWLFGAAWDVNSWKVWIVPLLAVPQLTHYILDGVLWRRRSMGAG